MIKSLPSLFPCSASPLTSHFTAWFFCVSLPFSALLPVWHLPPPPSPPPSSLLSFSPLFFLSFFPFPLSLLVLPLLSVCSFCFFFVVFLDHLSLAWIIRVSLFYYSHISQVSGILLTLLSFVFTSLSFHFSFLLLILFSLFSFRWFPFE